VSTSLAAKTRAALHSQWRRLARSRLLRASGIYTVTSFANAAIPFLMLPLFTRYLTPEDYGVVAMYQVLLGIVGAFTGLNVHGAVIRRYYDRDVIDFPQYVSNCLYVLGGSVLITGILMWGLAAPISHYMQFPAGWLWTVLLSSAGQFLALLILYIWQAQEKPMKYAVFQISQTFSNVCVSALLVVGLGMGWKGRVLGQVFSCLVFGSLSLVLLQHGKWLRWELCEGYVRNALAFGLPLIPHAIGMYVITATDRVLLANLRGVAETGIYVVAIQIGMVVYLLQDSFNQAWVPWFYAELKRNDAQARRRIVKLTYAYDILITLVALGFAFAAAKLLGVFVGRKFVAAASYLPWVCMGYAFNGMYKMVTNYCFYAEKTRVVSCVTFCTAIVNAIACYLLIKMNGAVGAAQGTMIALFLSFILTWIAAARIYKMPWSFRREGNSKLGQEALLPSQ
jgi:O-antigen/teichoic acid export membrane protein